MSRTSAIIFIFSLLTIIVVIAVGVRHEGLSNDYSHPDEVISVKVTEHLLDNATVNTNWQFVDLPSAFKYPQYNFSGYLLSAAAYLHSTPTQPDTSTLDKLRFFSFLLSVLTIVVVFYVATRLFGFAAGGLSSATVAVNPLLSQDSLYARPETFLTFLFAVFIGTISSRSISTSWKVTLSSLLLGFMIGVKVSMLFFLPLLLLVLERDNDQKARSTGYTHYLFCCIRHLKDKFLVILACVLTGFFISTPYSFFNFQGFLNGVNYLRNQYSSGDSFHGIANGGLIDRICYSFEYFNTTMGWPIFLLLPASIALLYNRKRYSTLSIYLLALSFCLYFSTYPTFFERNFSHVLPIIIMFSCFPLVLLFDRISNKLFSLLLLIISAGVLMAPSVQNTLKLYHYALPDSKGTRHQAEMHVVQRKYGIPVKRLGWASSYKNIVESHASPCKAHLISIHHNENARSKQLIQKLKSEGNFSEVGRVDTYFPHVQASTLQVYVSPTTVFLYKSINQLECVEFSKTQLTLNNLGEKLATTITDSENWRLGGLPNGSPSGPLGEPTAYASWVGSDNNTGRLVISANTYGLREFVLPYTTGPVAGKLIIRVIDEQTGNTIYRKKVKKSFDWKYLRIAIPTDTKKVAIIAIDRGADWGEWFALALPRRIVNFAPYSK